MDFVYQISKFFDIKNNILPNINNHWIKPTLLIPWTNHIIKQQLTNYFLPHRMFGSIESLSPSNIRNTKLHLSNWRRPQLSLEFFPDSKVHGANMGPIWVLSAPSGPHIGPMNRAIKVFICHAYRGRSMVIWVAMINRRKPGRYSRYCAMAHPLSCHADDTFALLDINARHVLRWIPKIRCTLKQYKRRLLQYDMAGQS